MSNHSLKISDARMTEIISESFRNVVRESNDQRELRNQLAREILGTDTFEEFYKRTGFWVGAKDCYLMTEYFRRLAELESQQKGGR